ncbi:YwgA family protein [Oceanobacillus sp. FSL H7-0719]|uniref:YwgA family protein n=1 Tax=Oceanobacillus sp. FSL H7-0719 TaxID=2954507 RepID=UPI0032433C49
MLINHAKLIRFFQIAEDITGRKKLQKMIYILQKCNIPFEERYQFHFYGPYSEELTLRVEELCNLGFLAEEREEKTSYYQYHYQITAAGEEFLKQFTLDLPDMSDKIQLLKGKSSRFLELVSTLLYFDDLEAAEQIEKLHHVKPKQRFTDEEIQEAMRFIHLIQH